MADFILTEGLGAATLRPLAAAAGTSDRMLLYYFKDKVDIVTTALNRIAERMTAQLDLSIPAGKQMPFDCLLEEVWKILASEKLKQFMPLWLDLAAGASRGRQPHLLIAGQIADGYLNWIASHLAPLQGYESINEAARFMVKIEGMYLLHAVGRGSIATMAMRSSKP